MKVDNLVNKLAAKSEASTEYDLELIMDASKVVLTDDILMCKLAQLMVADLVQVVIVCLVRLLADVRVAYSVLMLAVPLDVQLVDDWVNSQAVERADNSASILAIVMVGNSDI